MAASLSLTAFEEFNGERTQVNYPLRPEYRIPNGKNLIIIAKLSAAINPFDFQNMFDKIPFPAGCQADLKYSLGGQLIMMLCPASVEIGRQAASVLESHWKDFCAREEPVKIRSWVVTPTLKKELVAELPADCALEAGQYAEVFFEVAGLRYLTQQAMGISDPDIKIREFPTARYNFSVQLTTWQPEWLLERIEYLNTILNALVDSSRQSVRS